jgi:hypothetical protein
MSIDISATMTFADMVKSILTHKLKQGKTFDELYEDARQNYEQNRKNYPSMEKQFKVYCEVIEQMKLETKD